MSGVSSAENAAWKSSKGTERSPEDTMGNMPFAVEPADIVAAMRKVDELGRQ